MDRQDGTRSIMQRTSDNHLHRRNILWHAIVVENCGNNATYEMQRYIFIFENLFNVIIQKKHLYL